MLDVKGVFEKDHKILGVKIGRELFIKNGTKKGYLKAGLNDGVCFCYLSSMTRRGRVMKGVSPTLTCGCSCGVVVNGKVRK